MPGRTFHILTVMLVLFETTKANHKLSNATIRLAVLISYTGEWEIGHKMASGVILGIESVKKRGLLPKNWTIDWDWRDTYCTPRRGLGVAVDLWSHFDTHPSAFIGGGCSVVCEPVGLLAAAWNLPMVAFGCTSNALSNKFNFPTFTRVVGTWLIFAPIVERIVERLGWRRVAIVTTTQVISQLTANAIKARLERSGVAVFYYTYQQVFDAGEIGTKQLEEVREIVRSIKREARSEYYVFSYLLFILEHYIRP